MHRQPYIAPIAEPTMYPTAQVPSTSTQAPSSSVLVSVDTIAPTYAPVSSTVTDEPTSIVEGDYEFWTTSMIIIVTMCVTLGLVGFLIILNYVYQWAYTKRKADPERRPLMERIKRRANPV